MREWLIKSRYFIRFGEIFVPALSWIIITFPLWMSPFHPAIVAYFIISFNLYFLYKAVNTAYYATKSYRTILIKHRVNFSKRLLNTSKSETISHFIIIPNYKELLTKLESTINAIARNDYPYKNIYLVLAFEKREEKAEAKAEHLKNKYKDIFKDIITSYHTLEENEEAGKASNQTHAAILVEEFCSQNKIPFKNALITICDADSHFSKNYFSYLTYQYLKDPDRKYHFYWAPVLLYNNFWQLPFFVRMQATLSSILRLAFLSQKDQLIQISTYSTNLELLKSVGYWDVDIIPEDWHIYYQVFFKYGEKVKTIPLFTIINGDAVYSGGMLNTFKNRYEQEKRWAWGVSDIAFAWNKLFSTPHIPLMPKFKRVLYLVETHLFWPTSFFVLTISASIPPLINPLFKRTVLGFLLPQLSGVILTTASAMLLLYAYLDIQLRRRVNIKTNSLNVPFLLIQWYLLPIVSFVLSSLPALDAHTRILFGKKIKYKVTEKV